MEQAIRMIYPLEVLCDLAAQEAARDGMRRIAPQLRAFTEFVDVD